MSNGEGSPTSPVGRASEPLPPRPDLCFIKTQNTPEAAVEVHIASAASDYQQRVLEAMSDFNVADHGNGTWQVWGPHANGWPTLYFIKTANTDSGTIEVHWDAFDPSTHRYIRNGDLPTLYNQGDGANGTWQVCSTSDGAPADLFFIKTLNTPGGWVEVHAASADSHYKQRILDVVSDFSVADRENGIWQLGAPYVNGWPTLYFIKTANTDSGKIEVHWGTYNPSANAYRRVDDVPTWFTRSDGALGAWQLLTSIGVPLPVFFFVQDQGTASGRVEVQAASASSRYATLLFDQVSDFAVETDGVWQMVER
jgi:hypothetical protein